ncbi:MAG TPA: hypothetical protein VIX81_06870 [Gammaproteobacteria bacterium]
MELNPELRRNLWLELGPQRLLLMPLVLGLLFALAYALADGVDAGRYAVAVTAAIAYGLVCVLWGMHLAGEAVLGEVAARTWDWQRMSSVAPWSMTWGKLLGSTLYPWYAALFCLPAFALGVASVPGVDLGWWLGMLLGGAVLAHALGLTWSLLLVRYRGDREAGALQRRSSAYLVLLLLLLFGLPALLDPLQQAGSWYGRETGSYFALGSLLLFAAWAVFGAYRLMRSELQFRNGPWAWLGFTAYLMGYLGGFVDPDHRLFACYLLGLGLTLVAAFAEPRDPLGLRRLGQALRERAWTRAQQAAPPWLLGLGVSVALAAALLLQPASACRHALCPEGSPDQRLLSVLLLLFVLRDLGLLGLVSLRGRSRRPEFATVIYLLVLYFVVPWLLDAVGAGQLTALFWPRADLAPAWAVGAAALGPGVLGVLLWRWRRDPGQPG